MGCACPLSILEAGLEILIPEENLGELLQMSTSEDMVSIAVTMIDPVSINSEYLLFTKIKIEGNTVSFLQ